MVYWIGVEAFLDTYNVSESYGLPGFTSVFQAELLAILEVCRWVGIDLRPKRNIAILILFCSYLDLVLNGDIQTGGTVHKRAE